jgi:omega-6 fatty acid desaturase (delta-12 desaturase)
MLFVVGHDACHGSFTTNRRLNAWIGRLAFLPSLTPYRAWELGHNQTHHVYTNLKTLDYVWRPYSKEEFDRLPWWRRALERVYRTPFGMGLYYAIEIWGRRLIVPPARKYVADTALCLVYAAALLAIGWKAVLPGVIWPFLCWSWAMGWAIFEHHTHPDVPWFEDEREWRAAGPQARCTIHAILPKPFDVILHYIMQHSAHHLDVTVPLYRLKDAQRAIEEAGARVVVYRWSPLTFLRHLRICKLYDYRSKRWTGFAG